MTRITFWIAGIYGLLVLSPLYFMFDATGRIDPPAITHPQFYYGFVGVTLAWQAAFLVLASDTIRFRLMMIPSALEKASYVALVALLYFQKRVGIRQMVTVLPDAAFCFCSPSL